MRIFDCRYWHPANCHTGDKSNKRRLLARGTGEETVPQDDHIYRVIELAGTSDKSVEDAIATAITRANKTIRDLRWFEVVQTRGHIENGSIVHFQVTLKVGFTMEDPN